VSRTFLGRHFQKLFDASRRDGGDEVILGASDSDDDNEDDGVAIRDRWTEAEQNNFEGQEHLACSYRFREYRKSEKRTADTMIVSMAYIPNSFLEEVSSSSYNVNSYSC
jgi:hypothetical protein